MVWNGIRGSLNKIYLGWGPVEILEWSHPRISHRFLISQQPHMARTRLLLERKAPYDESRVNDHIINGSRTADLIRSDNDKQFTGGSGQET